MFALRAEGIIVNIRLTGKEGRSCGRDIPFSHSLFCLLVPPNAAALNALFLPLAF
jgi:hypothetical protein